MRRVQYPEYKMIPEEERISIPHEQMEKLQDMYNAIEELCYYEEETVKNLQSLIFDACQSAFDVFALFKEEAKIEQETEDIN